MHIPDGYLSPQTYIPFYALFAGFLAAALKKIRSVLSAQTIPYLGMASAFSFLIMMFNVPIPGATTGHAVGAGLIAILLGPWSAVIAVSVALIIQALIFGDGGITAIGANCFNMGVVIPFVSYWSFRFIKGKTREGRRVIAAAFAAGYIGLNVAALLTAVEFGIQPLIASEAGRPLYAPYGLSVAVPAMALEHLLLFGIIEGLVTAVILKFFLISDPASIHAMKEE
ncbi:MAG: cobalt transporter CbiM [Spirochaetes bacterium]|jgi:cobalt/nickel transport system permease protein|nr:cobalt transporter CbiM [Spirochaetota bacterium]